MDTKRLGLITFAVALGASGLSFAATPKTYKKAATVPALKKGAITPTTLRSDVWPVPTAKEIDDATKFVRKTLKDYYNRTTVAKQKEAAKELLRLGIDTRDDAARRYVVLSDAAEVAAGAGEAGIVARAIDELARSFQVDPVDMAATRLADAARAAVTHEQVDALVTACLATGEQAVAGEQYDAAGRLLGTAEATVQRTSRIDLTTSIAERKKELEALCAKGSEYARAKATLATNADDRDAKTVAGRFLCFVKGDWDAGLPMLAAGSDEALQAPAARDLGGPQAASARAKLADEWWELSGKNSGVMRNQLRRRAVYWYRQAAPALTGVDKTAAEARLKEFQADRLRSLGLTPGLVADIYDGPHEDKKKLTRVDPQIDFEWPVKRITNDGVPKTAFSIVWSGVLNVPQSGSYTLVLIANDGGAVTVDGTQVVEVKEGRYKRTGERAVASLDEGVHRFQVKLWNTGGLARARFLWIPPGATGEEVVPADAFCHEAGEVASGH